MVKRHVLIFLTFLMVFMSVDLTGMVSHCAIMATKIGGALYNVCEDLDSFETSVGHSYKLFYKVYETYVMSERKVISS